MPDRKLLFQLLSVNLKLEKLRDVVSDQYCCNTLIIIFSTIIFCFFFQESTVVRKFKE